MTVSEQIIQVIDELCKKFGLAIDWTSENVIPYLTILSDKLIKYEIIMSSIWIIISIVALVGIVFAIRWGYEDDDFLLLIIFGSIIIGGISIVAILLNIEDVIQCLVFPEMYIFAYVSELVRSMQVR